MLLRDRLEYYNGPISAGGTWTLLSAMNNPSSLIVDGLAVSISVGGTVGTNDNPDVTFVGTHNDIFKYTVTCGSITDSANLSIRNVTVQPLDDCTGSMNIPTINFTGEVKTVSGLYIFECATDYLVESPASTNQNPPTWPMVRNGDVWAKFKTSNIVNLSIEVQGIESGMIALYSGGCTTNSFTLLHDQTSLTNILTTPVLTLLPNTSYYIRLSTLPFSGIDHYIFSISLKS